MLKNNENPEKIINKLNLVVVNDDEELNSIISEIITKNPSAVEDYKNGKENALKFLMGQLMKQTKGQADPNQSIKLIRSKLDK